jgi:hypothetical protein
MHRKQTGVHQDGRRVLYNWDDLLQWRQEKHHPASRRFAGVSATSGRDRVGASAAALVVARSGSVSPLVRDGRDCAEIRRGHCAGRRPSRAIVAQRETQYLRV